MRHPDAAWLRSRLKLIPRRALLALTGVPAAFAVVLVMLLAVPGVTPPAATHPATTPRPTPTAAVTVAQPTPSFDPTPTPTPIASPIPNATTFPQINSCQPSSVPWATSPREASPMSGLFVLHIPVLEYHRVVPAAEAGDSQSGLVISPDRFKSQMDLFEQQGWQTITMAQLAEDLARHIRPPARTFALTFDDGWDDGYKYALPVLQADGFAGTFYVIAGRIDRVGFLTSTHLRTLMQAGNEIGNHTFDHTSLSSVAQERDKFEIDTASSRIAQVTGRWPETMAYPYGGTNARVVAELQACKMLRLAVLDGPMKVKPATITPGPHATAGPAGPSQYSAYETWANRYDIPRIRVSPGESASGLLAKVAKAASGN